MTLGSRVTPKHQHAFVGTSLLLTIEQSLLAPQAGHRAGVDMASPVKPKGLVALYTTVGQP